MECSCRTLATSCALAWAAFGMAAGRAQAQPAPPVADIPSPKPPAEVARLAIEIERSAEPRGASDSPRANGAMAVRLSPAPLDPTDRSLPINLAAALRLSDDRPLVVAAAQASVMVASADLQRARVLWLPTLNLGFDYYRHDAGNQDLQTGNLVKPSTNFFYAGAGLGLQVPTTDAIFAPLAARQVLEAQRWGVQAAKNDALLETASAYFSVHQQRGIYAGTLDAVARARDLVDRIEKLSADLIPKVEADRAKNQLADLEQRSTSAREEWRIASADLTRVLRLDPGAVIVPVEPDHLAVTLIPPEKGVDELIPVGLTNRPELASQQALVQAALARLKQEKLRPLLPSVLITGFQTPEFYFNGGIFGTGSGSSLDQWAGRFDLSYQLVWQLESLGLGNRARTRERQGQQARAVVELFQVQDRVAAEVAKALARVQSARDRMGQAERGLREALITYEGNLKGLGETTRFGDVLTLVYRPQEVVVALQHLQEGYDRYFATVADYNRAQFQLYHDLGYPARGLACERPPGPPPMPVNTARPPYLPPVPSR
jgi:outer membrane protein TolC